MCLLTSKEGRETELERPAGGGLEKGLNFTQGPEVEQGKVSDLAGVGGEAAAVWKGKGRGGVRLTDCFISLGEREQGTN